MTTVWVVSDDGGVLAVLTDPGLLEEALRSYFWARALEDRAELPKEPWLDWHAWKAEWDPTESGVGWWWIDYIIDPAGPDDGGPGHTGFWLSGLIQAFEVWGS